MSVEVVTVWYNEAFLAPFFLRHYAYADRISLFYDLDTSDTTREIAAAFPNVRLIPFRFPDMLDDDLKVNLIVSRYKDTMCDWVLIADADEFLFFKEKEDIVADPTRFLAAHAGYDLFFATMYPVYRHRDDADLEPALPAVPQRRHGDAGAEGGINAVFDKPLLVRKGWEMTWTPGCHKAASHRGTHMVEAPAKDKAFSRLEERRTEENVNPHLPRVAPFYLSGAHWSMADPCFAVERRLMHRKPRMSKRNLAMGWGTQYHHTSEEEIRAELARHRDDPLLF